MLDTDCIHEIHRDWCGQCNPQVAVSSLENWINDVSQSIPVDPDPPVSMDELCELAGLPRHQVNQAVAAIRERHPDLPLVSDRNGIVFTMDTAAVHAFRNRAARTALTRIRRSYRGVLLPWLEQSGESEIQVRIINRQFEHLMENIYDSIELNGAGSSNGHAPIGP